MFVSLNTINTNSLITKYNQHKLLYYEIQSTQTPVSLNTINKILSCAVGLSIDVVVSCRCTMFWPYVAASTEPAGKWLH